MILQSFEVSSLHTSHHSFYAQFGYSLIPFSATVARVKRLSGSASTPTISKIVLSPLVAVTPEWRTLHHEFCENYSSTGTVIRDDECWLQWIPREVQRLCGTKKQRKAFSATPLDPTAPFAAECGYQWSDMADTSKVAVFLSAQYESKDDIPEIKIRELFASSTLLDDVSSLRIALESLIGATADPNWSEFRLSCPTVLWNRYVSPANWNSSSLGVLSLCSVDTHSNDGIMYHPLNSSAGMSGLQEQLKDNHLFLTLDSF